MLEHFPYYAYNTFLNEEKDEENLYRLQSQGRKVERAVG